VTGTPNAGSGLVFGPGLDPAGSAARFSVSALGLQFQGQHADLAVPGWSALRWRKGGFNDTQLLVEWTTPEGTFSLSVGDPASQNALLAHLPGATQETARPSRATRTASNSMIFLLVLLPILVIGVLVWQADRLIDWAVSNIPVETEIRLGREAFAQQRQNLAIAEDHPALPMLRQIGARLIDGSPYPYEFHIVRDESINAFAMPGGFVVVHTGLLASADSAEELAAVLAHEVQHVERRHGLRGLVHAAGWRVVLSLVLGNTGGTIAGTWVQNLGDLRFSRSQETDADLEGVKALVKADIDPKGMVAFFARLSQEAGRVPALLSSHPASDERMTRVEASFPKGRTYPPLPYDYRSLRGTAK
jgi:beta-barrel assembly-enhancing protease